LGSTPLFETLHFPAVTSAKHHECEFSNLVSRCRPFTSSGISATNAAAIACWAQTDIADTSIPTLIVATSNNVNGFLDMLHLSERLSQYRTPTESSDAPPRVPPPTATRQLPAHCQICNSRLKPRNA